MDLYLLAALVTVALPPGVLPGILQNALLTPSADETHNDPCKWSPKSPFAEYLDCVKRRVKRQYEYPDPYGRQEQPCHHYTMINQPGRRVGNVINKLTDSAICDRALYRRWYRFESAAGGIMPEQCVEEFHCGTHAPIWLNGRHPPTYNQPVDIEVCVSLAGECCRRRWYIRVTNCGDFFTYLLPDTPGCYMAYCIGNEFPCGPGLSSPTGFSPGCSSNFPKLSGDVLLTVDKEGTDIVFYCDYAGPIPRDTVMEYNWYVSEPEDRGDYPLWQETVREQRRSKLTEHRWMGKMGSSIYCRVRAKWANNTGVPSPAVQSEKYFAGVKIKQRVISVSEKEAETEIEFQSTVPITCLPQFSEACKLSIQVAHDQAYTAKRCVGRKMRQVVFGECSLDIKSESWREPQKIRVKAVRDFYHDGNKRMLVDFKPAFSTMLSPVWNNYQLPQVEVVTVDGPTAMCSSTGDPHYVTFDGLYYHVYLEGEFVLYKNTRIPVQINTRLERCGEVVSCNCAIAVMAADDVIVIDRCNRKRRNLAFGKNFPDGWKTLHRHALQQGDEFTEGLKIYEYDDGRRFTVHLPTGAYLEFQIGHQEKWIDLKLYASSDDWESTLGLCGTFDGASENDFTFRGGKGRTIPREGAACGEDRDVCEFAENWRVSDDNSFFSDEVTVELENHDFNAAHKFCSCEKQPDGTGAVTCNYHYDVDNCQAEEENSKGHDKTSELLEKARAREEAKRKAIEEARRTSSSGSFGSSGSHSRSFGSSGSQSGSFGSQSGSFGSSSSHSGSLGSSSSSSHSSLSGARQGSFSSSHSGSFSTTSGSGSTSRRFKRKRRDVQQFEDPALDQDDEDYFSSQFVYDQNYKGKEPSWPTASGKTEEQARNYCSRMLLQSYVWIVCQDHLKQQYENLIKSCITDIKVTDEYDWAISSLSLMASECTEAVHNDATLWGVDPNDPGILPTDIPIVTSANYTTTTTTQRPTTTSHTAHAQNILSVLCPAACSNRGRCEKGACVCERGYRGQDCAEEMWPTPQALYLSGGGVCDLSKQPCHHITVHGSKFRNSAGLKCIFQPVIKSKGHNTLLGTKVQIPAKFETFEEVVCPLPKDDVTSVVDGVEYEAYHLTVANDLLHKTDPNMLVVHDSRCLNCTITGFRHSCERIGQGDTCYIDGECYVRGERDPDNCCAACRPETSENSFSALQENKMPTMTPWRSTYEVRQGENWELNVQVKDPEGCDMDIQINNQNQRQLQVTQQGTIVHIKLDPATRSGRFSVSIEATDKCGATYQQNYHVEVKKSRRRPT